MTIYRQSASTLCGTKRLLCSATAVASPQSAQFPAMPTLSFQSCDEAIWQELFTKQQPVVIQGLACAWPCIADPMRQWRDLPQLQRRVSMADSVVPIEMGQHYMDPHLQKHQISLHSFLDFLIAHTSTDLNTNAAGQRRTDIPKVYLAQHTLSEVQVLKDDIEVPTMPQVTGKKNLYDTKIWFGGPKGTISPCHFDPFHNMLVQILGEKEVILIDTKYSDALYPAYGTVQKNTSLVNFECPDMSRHPKFAEVQGCKAILKPGDALFMPLRWWHYCKTEQLSCSVNFWWL